MTDRDPLPDLSELVTLWHRLSPEAQASLLRIAGAKAAPVDQDLVALERGDIFKINLDGCLEHETDNDLKITSRLCVIIQNDDGNYYSPTTIVAPSTSKISEKFYPQTAVLRGELRGSFDTDTAVLCGQVRTVSRTKIRIKDKIGSLPKEAMDLVDNALLKSLDMGGLIAPYACGLRDAAAMLEMDNQTIRLHAGELSPQEMRAVQAVLGWKRREMLAKARAKG